MSKPLTTEEAAKRLGVSSERVRQFCREGRIGKPFGRGWIITERELKHFMTKPRLTGAAGHKKRK